MHYINCISVFIITWSPCSNNSIQFPVCNNGMIKIFDSQICITHNARFKYKYCFYTLDF